MCSYSYVDFISIKLLKTLMCLSPMCIHLTTCLVVCSFLSLEKPQPLTPGCNNRLRSFNPNALVLGVEPVRKIQLPPHRTFLPAPEPEPQAAQQMNLQCCPSCPWLPHTAGRASQRYWERHRHLDFWDSKKPEYRCVCLRLGSQAAYTAIVLGCKKFIEDQHLWKERERSKTGQREN